MYIVIQLQGHQYIIKQGDTITVDKIDWDVSKEAMVVMAFQEDGKTVYVGRPFLDTIHIDFEIQDQIKWDKMHITKFHRKNRYERRIWFRPQKTILTVKNITVHA
jgi:large subunit ribosomal protein L21